MTTTTTVYGKIRIPTEAHKGLVDHAADLQQKHGGKLNVTLSGAEKPLTASQKVKHTKAVFGRSVQVKEKSNFVSHLHDLAKSGTEHLHVVAGSDRAKGYKDILDRYNGKPDRGGNIPFHFKSYQVHEYGAERHEGELPTHPSKIKHILPYTSATNVEAHAKKGDYKGFSAFYRNTPEHHVKALYNAIRGQKEHYLIRFKEWLTEEFLPWRS